MSVFMCHLQIRIYREIRSTSARYVPVCVCVSVCIHINVCACMCACMFCLFVCMYVRMYACINVSIRVCQYVCTYVCSMYVHLYTVSLYNAHSSDENSVSCTIPGFTPWCLPHSLRLLCLSPAAGHVARTLCIACTMFVCMYTCIYAHMSFSCIRMRVSRTQDCMHVCVFLPLLACLPVCMHVCNVCMRACTHVYMHVCIYVQNLRRWKEKWRQPQSER